MSLSPTICYAREASLDLAAFRRVLAESGLGTTRPMADEDRLRRMLAGSNLIVTARLDGELVGLARCITDFAWCCYVSELAVPASAQGLGVGRGLLDETQRQIGPGVSLILVSVPEAVGFYERAEMTRIADAFWFKRAF